MQNENAVCPLSMAGTVKQCHPQCKLNDNGKCMLALYLKAKSDQAQKDN